jgi:hypothetical protein
MNSIVVMPTYERPEMLALSLERLSQVRECPPIHIYVDRRVDKSIFQFVRDTYSPAAELHFTEDRPECTSGTWNILHAIQEGYNLGANFIFLVEEDVMVYPQWHFHHLAKLWTGEYKASCGRRLPAFNKKYGDIYTNPGSCLSRELVEAIVPHINENYFRNTGGYIRETFKREPLNSSLDDGLVRVVMADKGWRCAYPAAPLCAHQGFEFYNNIDIYMNNEGTIQNRIAKLRTMLAKISPKDRYAPDFEPFAPSPLLLQA